MSDTMRARLRRAAELGSARAQYDLAVMLATGHGGFAKDPAEARLWYERGAHSGDLQSQLNFGLMCVEGEGGPASVPEGLGWLRRVAALDLASDLWAPLVVCEATKYPLYVYENGALGIDADSEKAAVARGRRAAAQAVMDRQTTDDDSAVGHDADGKVVKRPFAFANPDEARSVLWCTYSTISEFFTMAPDGKIEGA